MDKYEKDLIWKPGTIDVNKMRLSELIYVKKGGQLVAYLVLTHYRDINM